MPPSSPPNTEPSTALTLAAATDPSSGTHTTAIIIGVSVGASCLILLIAGYRLWKYLPRRSKAPLPPKGPLAHDRQRQMAPAHPGTALDYPHPMEVPPFPPHTFSGPANFHRHRSDRTDDTSNPPPSPSVIDSQVRLVQTPTGSEETVELPRSGRGSFSGSPTVRHSYLPRRQRTRSMTGSVHSSRSRMSSTSATIRGRGPPHARHSRVDIVLPQPLAPALYNGNTVPGPSRIASHSRASSRERPESREGYAMGTSIDGLPMQPTEINYYHPGRYPPPVPPLPMGYHTPHPSDAASPTSAAPFLAQPAPSPERGPPPLPPPKDSPSRSSRRPPSDSNYRNQRQ